jgi:hypothetical protein
MEEWRYSSILLNLSTRRRRVLTDGEIALDIHCTGGWVGPRAIVDIVEKRRISLPCQESNPDSSVVRSIVAIRLSSTSQIIILKDCYHLVGHEAA